jgi:hypothetical protein
VLWMFTLQADPSDRAVCGRSLAGIVGSIPVLGMDVCLLRVLYVARQNSMRRAHHSSRGVRPCMSCLNVIVKPR